MSSIAERSRTGRGFRLVRLRTITGALGLVLSLAGVLSASEAVDGRLPQAPADASSQPRREPAGFPSVGVATPIMSARSLGLTEATPPPEPGVESPTPPSKTLYPSWTGVALEQPFDPQARASGTAVIGFEDK